MKRWLISCSLVCLTPMLAAAQTAKIQAEIDTELAQARAYEDIEIMRRLLQRKLAGFAQSCRQCHQASTAGQAFLMFDRSASMSRGGDALAGSSDSGSANRQVGDLFPHHHGLHAAASESIPVDGHYLKGTGIVMQAQLPASLLQIIPASPAAKKPPAPPSEWEVIRKQLRGEKVEASVAADDFHSRIPEGASLQDVLVKVLAEHGKHFQSLADNERLTLTVTFRPQKEGAGGATRAGGMGDMGGARGEAMGGGNDGAINAYMMAAGAAPQVGPRSSSKDYELLADFRMRQGHYVDAAKTLDKAIELNTETARAAGLYRKLASALLLQSPTTQQTLDRANDLLRKAMAVKPAPAPSLKTPLPTRLIISASKSALQKASAGSLDDFRKQLTITWLRFDHPVLRHPVPEGSDEGGGDSPKGP